MSFGKFIICSLYCFGFAVACGPQDKAENSKFSYGANENFSKITKSNYNTSYLQYVSPSSRILICPTDSKLGKLELTVNDKIYTWNQFYGSLIATATQEWNNILLRQEWIRVEFANSCKQPPGDTTAIIRVAIKGPDDSLCGTYSTTNAYSKKQQLNEGRAEFTASLCINNVRDDQTLGGLLKTAYHEVGHFYGLCDQYGRVIEKDAKGNTKFKSNGKIKTKLTNEVYHRLCSPDFRYYETAESVMNKGKNEFESISDDDKLGVRILTCLKGSGNYKDTWQEHENVFIDYINDNYVINPIRGKSKNVSFSDEINRLETLGYEFKDYCKP